MEMESVVDQIENDEQNDSGQNDYEVLLAAGQQGLYFQGFIVAHINSPLA